MNRSDRAGSGDGGVPRTIWFGAFDRHNLGDLLFAHLVPPWLARDRGLIRAGIVDADLTELGGHRVESLRSVLSEDSSRPLHLVHAGGEILSCDRWVARMTTLTDPLTGPEIRRLERDRSLLDSWLDDQPGFNTPAPYVIRRRDLPAGSRVDFRAVGGVGLRRSGARLKQHVFEALSEADSVTVRDNATLDTVREMGIRAALEVDPVACVAERFGQRIQARADHVGSGHLAVQLGADLADDLSLGIVADQIRRFVSRFDWPILVFRAGAAPWHDDPGALQRLIAMIDDRRVRFMHSLDIWDICAAIAGARSVLATSLHVRIVAESFRRPAVSLIEAEPHAVGQSEKVAAYVRTWFPQCPRLAGVLDIAAELADAARGRPPSG